MFQRASRGFCYASRHRCSRCNEITKSCPRIFRRQLHITKTFSTSSSIRSESQTSTNTPPQPPTISLSSAPSTSTSTYLSVASLSSVASVSSYDEYDDETASFRFLPAQLSVFSSLANSMQNCSRGLAALAFGSVVMDALQAVEHAHHHVEHAQHTAQAAVEAGAAAASAVTGQVVTTVGQQAATVVEHASTSVGSGALLLQEVVRAVSLTDAAFCVNEVIPALLIAYAAVPFQVLAKNPNEPHMALALKGVGRLSVTMQQLAWTSGSVAVVLLLTAAAEYPPIVGVASGSCLALAMARGASLWWVISQHTTTGEEVARTLAALRGGSDGRKMNPLDRAASWLALGVLLQAEERLHATHHRLHAHQVTHHHPPEPSEVRGAAAFAGSSPLATVSASAAVAVVALTPGGNGAITQLPPSDSTTATSARPYYAFDLEEEQVLRSLVEAANAAGLAISLLALATLALGLAEAAGESSNDWVSSVILAAQKAANALALFASGAAFDRALHNDDGNTDTDHLLDGLGREHSGMTGLFNSMAVLSVALLMAGSVALLVPSMEESALGVLLGDGVMHASADLLMEVLEAL